MLAKPTRKRTGWHWRESGGSTTVECRQWPGKKRRGEGTLVSTCYMPGRVQRLLLLMRKPRCAGVGTCPRLTISEYRTGIQIQACPTSAVALEESEVSRAVLSVSSPREGVLRPWRGAIEAGRQRKPSAGHPLERVSGGTVPLVKSCV